MKVRLTPAPAAATPLPAVVPHSAVENLAGLATGVVVVSLGVFFLQSAHAVTGGTAGLALLLAYATGVPFTVLFVVVNLPFFALAVWQKGVRFTLASAASTVAVSLLTPVHSLVLHVEGIDRVYGAVIGNLLAGIGLIILFRHRSSLGGFNVLALLAQERLHLRAGYVQMILDVCVVVAALVVVDARTMLISAAGAIILDVVLAFNHRPGRYRGTAD